MKTRLILTPLKAAEPLTGQERYRNIQQLLDELILALAEVAIMGAIIIVWVALWVIFQPKIKAMFFMVNEFIKPIFELFGG